MFCCEHLSTLFITRRGPHSLPSVPEAPLPRRRGEALEEHSPHVGGRLLLRCYFAVGVFEDVGDVRPDSQNSSGANESDPLDTLRGYAFFVESPDCDACLLDYYAILPEYRDAGLGGRTLQRLAELVRDRGKYILLETEDIDFAKNDGQVAERTRRDAFYTRNGCVKTDVKGKVFTVHYAVWALGLEAAHGADEAARSTAFDRACADMNTLYQLMIPGEKFRLFVKIVRASET